MMLQKSEREKIQSYLRDLIVIKGDVTVLQSRLDKLTRKIIELYENLDEKLNGD